ncbi:hypothetical protein [Hydrogenophaga sp.]|uniref:hypothetical protein n=1 Tax=Hydrogenophaga sp. TaxID=1904254 RepID=UPI00351E4621
MERGRWYLQRHGQHLPTAGGIMLFDRRWYHVRALNASWALQRRRTPEIHAPGAAV